MRAGEAMTLPISARSWLASALPSLLILAVRRAFLWALPSRLALAAQQELLEALSLEQRLST